MIFVYCASECLFGLWIPCFVLYNSTMPRNRLLFVLAALIVVIFALHILALALHLYWTLWWYDIMLHFLGGVFVGLLTLWFRFFSGYARAPHLSSETQLFALFIPIVLLVGIGWELFEYALGQNWSVEGYWLDTGMDIALDVLGGAVAFLFFKSKFMSYERKT